MLTEYLPPPPLHFLPGNMNTQVGVSAAAVEAFDSALSVRAEADLVDMDEHFDDVSKDWTNPVIAAM